MMLLLPSVEVRNPLFVCDVVTVMGVVGAAIGSESICICRLFTSTLRDHFLTRVISQRQIAGRTQGNACSNAVATAAAT